jgi:hypothetical protein
LKNLKPFFYLERLKETNDQYFDTASEVVFWPHGKVIIFYSGSRRRSLDFFLFAAMVLTGIHEQVRFFRFSI